MYRDKKGQLWVIKSEMIDIETGEVLTRYQAEKYYIKVKHEIIYTDEHTKKGEHRRVKKYQWLCRKYGQQATLF